MAIKDPFKTRLKKWVDPEFGYEIIEPLDLGKSRTLYFTSSPFLEDDEHLIFSMVKDGVENLYKLNYHTGDYIQLTDEPDLFCTTSYVDRKNNVLYVRSPKKILSVNLSNYENVNVLVLEDITKEKVELLPSVAITCDGSYLITAYPFTYHFKNNDQQVIPDQLYRMIKVDLKTREVSDVRFTNYKIDHIQCSPTDPNYLTYCAWGYWPTHQRVWGCHLNNTIGGPLGAERTNEHRTHEYFIGDGSELAYHGKFFRMENEVFKRFQDSFGIMNADGSNDRVYFCEKGYSPGHSAMSRDKKMIIADGNNRISFIHLDEKTMQATTEPIFTHSSSMNCNYVHPHPSISKNKQYVVFATDFKKGEDSTRFYLINMEKR